MNDSAKTELSGRERKREATYAALSAHARELTAARGLGGFTVEELAEAAGVSRRTFFNYFEAKEDAVLGARKEIWPEGIDEKFLAHEGSLLEALRFLQASMTKSTAELGAHFTTYMELLHSEPALMERLHQVQQKRHHEMAELVAAREGIGADDPFAQNVSSIFGFFSMACMKQFVKAEHALQAEGGAELTEEATGTRYNAIADRLFADAARLFTS